ncbi:MAG: peptidoglycan DD-metalloendopeptidase family protein [Actinomycetota bacterium]
MPVRPVFAALNAALFVASSAGAAEARSPILIPPVDAAIERHFEAPESDYGRGHRGVDYDVSPGTPVRATAAGTVSFAGTVAGSRAVSLEHSGGLVTTYSILGDIYVTEGESIGQGHWIGSTARSHPDDASGLHLGVKLDGRYVDPWGYLGAVDVTRALHLAPLAETYADGVNDEEVERLRSSVRRPCERPRTLGSMPPPPNDNVAIAIAGIATETDNGNVPALYDGWLSDGLGYPAERTYAFSYRGSKGERLHTSYARADTVGRLADAGARLRRLLERIHWRHPGAGVDLVAHSQGGLVARVLLEKLSESWEPALPIVEHLVTLATPHTGTPAATLPGAIDEGPVGALALGAVARAIRSGDLPLPDPRSSAVTELATGSTLMSALAQEDVAFGTRVLALAMPHDLLVPADRASLRGSSGRVLAPAGVWGHSSILRSNAARTLVYDFMRDAAASCAGAWDRVGPLLGAGLGLGYRALGWVTATGQRWGTLSDGARVALDAARGILAD